MRWCLLVAAMLATGLSASAQGKLHVSLSAMFTPGGGPSHKMSAIVDGRMFAAQQKSNQTDLPDGPALTLELDDSGEAKLVHLNGSGISIGHLYASLAEKSDDYVLMMKGRPDGFSSVFGTASNGWTVSEDVAVSVTRRSRMKSVLGSGAGGLVGASSSPYYRPLSEQRSDQTPVPGYVVLDLNLGLARNGQSLPPLKLDYMLGSVDALPEHVDIVKQPGSGDAPLGIYRLPQATLKITYTPKRTVHFSDFDYVYTYAFSHRNSDEAPYINAEDHPYVVYEANFVGGALTGWTRTFYDGDTVVHVDTSEFAEPGVWNDWHDQGSGAVRQFRLGASLVNFGLVHDLDTIDPNKPAAEAKISTVRMEYTQWTEETSTFDEFGYPVDTLTLTHSIIPVSTEGFGGTLPLVSTQFFRLDRTLLGQQGPDGGAALTELNVNVAGATGYPGTVRRVFRAWKDASPVPAGAYASTAVTDPAILVTDYTYAPDWTGLKTLPATMVTTAAGNVIADESTAYGLDQAVTLDGAAQKVIVATRTTFDRPAGAEGRRGLTSVYKKFQSNTASFFYADLPYASENPDGTKQSYAYQRGTYTSPIGTTAGSFAPTENPDSPSSAECTAVRTVIINGTVSGANGATPTTTAPELGGVSFDPLYLITGRSTATVEIRSFGMPVRTEVWVWNGETTAFERVSWQEMAYTPYGALTRITTDTGAVIYAAGWTGIRKDWEEDATGHRTGFTYDAGGRIWKALSQGAGPIPEQLTTYGYDAENRVISAAIGPATSTPLTTTYHYNGSGLLDQQINPDGTTVDFTYADGGRTVTTTYNKGKGGTAESAKTTTNFKDGRVKKIDGSAVTAEYYDYTVESRKVTPSSANPFTLPLTQVFIGVDGTNADTAAAAVRYRQVVTDLLGRTVEERSPGIRGASLPLVRKYEYNDVGQIIRIRTVERDASNVADPDKNRLSADTLYVYDGVTRQLIASGLDVDKDGKLLDGTTDRFVKNTSFFTKNYPGSTDWWVYSRIETFQKDGDATTVQSESYSRVSGLYAVSGTDGRLAAETISFDARANPTRTRTFVDRSNGADCRQIVATHLADGTETRQYYSAGFATYSRDYTAGTTVPTDTNAKSQTQQLYDAFGRLSGSIDARGNGTAIDYWPGTALPKHVDAGSDADGHTLSAGDYHYDSAGRVDVVTNAAGQQTSFAYDVRGRVVDQWGPAASPVHNEYDPTYGHQTQLRTYRTVALGAQPTDSDVADITTWDVDAATGLVNSKTDAKTRTVSYGYGYDFTTGEKTATRTSARFVPGSTTVKITATSHYALTTGDLTLVTYNDGRTSPVHYYTSRGGQLDRVDDATGSRFFHYDAVGAPRSEFLPAFFQSHVLTTLLESTTTVTPHIPGRYAGFQLGVSATVETGDASRLKVDYTYDDFSRIDSVKATYGAVENKATYDYTLGTSHWEKLTHGSFSVGRTLEAGRDTIAEVIARFAGHSAPLAQFVYKYDGASRRESAWQAGDAYRDFVDPTFTRYGYDEAGQMNSAQGYLGADVGDTKNPLPGRGFGYTYDRAGNRRSTTVDTETVNYENGPVVASPATGGNALNQIERRALHRPHVSGTAHPDSAVRVGGSDAVRQGTYWDAALDLRSTYTSVTVDALRPGANRSGTTPLLTRAATETFTYDLDGNLTDDGLWHYEWDAENRLLSMTRSAAAVSWNAPDQSLTFTYDYLGRRVRKIFSGLTGAGGVRDPSDTVYVWNGWLLVAEFKVTGTAANGQPSTLTLARTHVWGVDPSGGLGSTGGVGALVFTAAHNGGTLSLRDVVSDASGNVTALVNPDPASGEVTAAYEYDPFGQLLRQVGAEAAANPFRHATKYYDSETGLHYYGYRYYDASAGRFINRDPIEEAGGNNLYAFVGNSPLNGWDALGLFPAPTTGDSRPGPPEDTKVDYDEWSIPIYGPFDDQIVIPGAPRGDVYQPTTPNGAPSGPIRRAQDGTYRDRQGGYKGTAPNRGGQTLGDLVRAGILPSSRNDATVAGSALERQQGDYQDFQHELAWQQLVSDYGIEGAYLRSIPFLSAGPGIYDFYYGETTSGRVYSYGEWGWKGVDVAGTAIMVYAPVAGRIGGIQVAESNVLRSQVQQQQMGREAVRDAGALAGDKLSHLNGAIAEAHGYEQALARGQVGIVSPGKVTAPGVDFATFDPARRQVVIWDAKYRGPGGTYPSSIPAAKLQGWTTEVRAAVESMADSAMKRQILDALNNGRVRGEIFRWPQ